MLNDERVRLMTRLADFEQEHGDDLQIARKYYRSDYIGICLLKGFLQITVVYLAGLLLWVLYKMDFVLEKLNSISISDLGRGILVSYVVIAVLFLVLTYVIAAVRYYRAERAFHTYRNQLKHLEKEYVLEGSGQEPVRKPGKAGR